MKAAFRNASNYRGLFYSQLSNILFIKIVFLYLSKCAIVAEEPEPTYTWINILGARAY